MCCWLAFIGRDSNGQMDKKIGSRMYLPSFTRARGPNENSQNQIKRD